MHSSFLCSSREWHTTITHLQLDSCALTSNSAAKVWLLCSALIPSILFQVESWSSYMCFIDDHSHKCYVVDFRMFSFSDFTKLFNFSFLITGQVSKIRAITYVDTSILEVDIISSCLASLLIKETGSLFIPYP